MKISQWLREAKDTLVEKATTGKGVYITEQIPYIGDYIFAKSVSKILDEKAERTINSYYSLAMGTTRLIGIGASIVGGFPLGIIIVNGAIGGVEGLNTLEYRMQYNHKNEIKNMVSEARKILEGNNKN